MKKKRKMAESHPPVDLPGTLSKRKKRSRGILDDSGMSEGCSEELAVVVGQLAKDAVLNSGTERRKRASNADAKLTGRRYAAASARSQADETQTSEEPPDAEEPSDAEEQDASAVESEPEEMLEAASPDISAIASESAEQQAPAVDEGLQEALGEQTSASSDMQQDDAFTILEDQRRKEKVKVHRVLPAWLAKPHVIKADICEDKVDLDLIDGLCPKLRERLRSNGITYFFPVQQFVIPVVLDSIRQGWHIGRGGYRPSDICCSAPTGSGKTLAFVLPIVQALQCRVVPRVRALVVLPVRDLALQVYKVFHQYCEHTSLRVGLIVGQKNLASEQASLVKSSLRAGEYESLVDIVVATPGRLVDHIHDTPGFDLSQLRFLVIDEADRMMDEIKQDWLSLVEQAVCRRSDRDVSNVVTASREAAMQIPLQKLLFSATLSQNPEKLQQLNLFQPQLYTSVPDKPASGQRDRDSGDDAEASHISRFEGKYTTPTTLTEYFIECASETKPLMLMYLILVLKYQRVLCFTNSVETTRRLYNLLDLAGGGIVVQQFSSAEPAYKRSLLVKRFEAGKVHVLVCSDAMARGMDVKGVECVISYDNPTFVKTYIHRVGRTARAGRAGAAITILEKKQVHHFKEMMKSAGKGKSVTEMKVKKSQLKPLVDTYKAALQRLPRVL